MMRVLMVEDDAATAAYVRRELEREGFSVELTSDGRDGLARARAEKLDLMIVDRMLPGLDGLDLVRSLRQAQDLVPILVLTALGEVGDRVRGLEVGADDYLIKPFDITELVARLHALLRRRASDRPVSRSLGDLHLDLLSRRVTRGGRPIELMPREFGLLDFLLLNQDRVVTRTMILEQVWGFNFDPKTNFIETHISRLRAKLRLDPADPELIHTVRGSGYIAREAP